ncbi:hypothetical protein Ahy_B03g064772 [Arachis hypogaea]|uniref:Endonuclease/exonuclease/phosphatase domain-containing protein n=1 Tax=Arachis hypogaea TaxID=3818 RepID=A0A445A0F5_ARAHY|nr:hypothetical protein Ahy_B03g064772 [Arachis hypogaea]
MGLTPQISPNRDPRLKPWCDFVLGDSPFSVCFVMNIISWNCRGAGGKTFPTLIRDIRREYNTNFIILLETYINGSCGATIRDKIGFDNSFIVEANGHSEGIWCLWDSDWLRILGMCRIPSLMV